MNHVSTPRAFLAALADHGYDHATGVPCSLLSGLFRELEAPASVTGAELEQRGFSMAIYANHVLRSSIRAIQDSLARIVQDVTTANIEQDIVPVSEVFRLQGLATMLETQAAFEARGSDIASAVAGVAS